MRWQNPWGPPVGDPISPEHVRALQTLERQLQQQESWLARERQDRARVEERCSFLDIRLKEAVARGDDAMIRATAAEDRALSLMIEARKMMSDALSLVKMATSTTFIVPDNSGPVPAQMSVAEADRAHVRKQREEGSRT